MALKEYARKRDFTKTPEPVPDEENAKGETRGGFFCVQRHDASRLHYDFRLEVGGVLVSWAVPKGPSLDPARKPLAMKVEDHPLDYGTFEGNIPAGNYGGGSVMLWDKGNYEVIGEPAAEGQLERGDFKFALNGTKLKGAFAIVRMKNRGKGNEWLLIKKKDEFAVPDYAIDEYAWSVATQRTQEQIANNVLASPAASLDFKAIDGVRKASLPNELEPMLATGVTEPPRGEYWTYEIKWDGVRALCLVDDGRLSIYSRRGNRCEPQYPELRDLAEHLNVKTIWLDGEICVLNDEGRSSFELIQPRISANLNAVPRLAENAPVTLFLFDVLYVDGYDLRGAALEDRRQVLDAVVTPNERIRISETFEVEGEQMFEAARQMRLEGVIAKDRRSKYEGTRSRRWQKLKVLNEQEFVIAGFTTGLREYFGALILAVNDAGKLRHVGQVGTGFDAKQMKAIHARLQLLVNSTNPLYGKPRVKGATWVKPEVICQVRFLEWTDDGNLRGPVFVALRDDKPADEVIAEPAATKAPTRFQGKQAMLDIDGHRLKFTNLDKLFYPKDGWQKRDLLTFYDSVAACLLPHLHDRPLSLKRYPNGIAADYFFQKNAGQHFPDWMRCEPITESDPPKTNHYPLAQDHASLLYLVNLGCIDHNPWMSRVGSLDHPDWMLLDLDPVDAPYDLIVDAALLIRELLHEVGLEGYPKTTGGDGMHVYVPLEPVYTFEQARAFAELLSHLALEREPNLFTTPRSVNKRRKGRVYFDYLQIGTGKTISAPYVVRAYDGAPVATPLEWNEVKHGLKPSDFRIDNAPERFRKKGDLFAPVLAGGQRLEDALRKLNLASEEPPAQQRARGKKKPRA